MKKRIALLGSTGSIGTQAIEVVKSHPDKFEITVLTARSNEDLLISQATELKPKVIVISDTAKYEKVKDALKNYEIQVLAGEEGLAQVVQLDEVDEVITAIVGYAGLKPTLKAIESGKNIALANKETLVVAGELVMGLAKEHKVNVCPIDSEHSAIFQCLVGEKLDTIEKIYLTASGGPFRGMSKDSLSSVTKEQALKHPNWDMGAKITIDSATLMNKGLEAIEAKWLFDLTLDQIDVIIHPQSIIHSVVQFKDGSMKAQMGLPDMKLPIQYALSYPERLDSDYKRFNFADYPNLTFEPVDKDTFRNIALAFQALKRGGNMPCIVNAANEIAVEAFLHDQIGFLQMPEIIEDCMESVNFVENPNYKDYVSTDNETRSLAQELIKQTA